MDTQSQLQTYLSHVDIDAAAAKAYIALVKLGPVSALQLSKATGSSRTQTYRHLETLQAKGLVSSEQLSYGTLFRSLPLENLEATIAMREAETTALKHDLKDMSELLQHLAGASGPKATTHHYYGLAGLKQANWNLTKATQEYRVFEAAHLSQHLDAAFTKRHRERQIERQLISYDLTNDTEAKAADLEPFAPSRAFLRHIDPKILTISFEVYIYDNVVTLLDYSKENPHALEIHHPTLYQMMFQLFEAMWQLGEPLEITY
ncbi:MAG TPA: helix-turn-helix domain-containing protein [Candidatus Saccharimonadales bacterium]|nr:helix-turn-helix domain-containing protein [Candidatus Saccharimonadales bacterium]